MATKKLGKGFDALFADNSLEESASSAVKLKLMDIEPNREQPRKHFDEEMLAELADSIAQHGVIQPLIVRPLRDGGYQLVAGERRWRAARMAGLYEVPVVIKELSDDETIELAMVENLQREDLNPLEEAQGYKYMMEKLSITQEEAAKKVGKSRPAVANALRLLTLPEEILKMVEAKQISPGHARALLAFGMEDEMIAVANLIVKKGLSVREVERLAKQSKKIKKPTAPKKRDTFYEEVELAVTNLTGRRVRVRETSKTIEIEYFDKDDLSSIVKAITGEK
ncbi:MAG: ParB/RepB/Spo0J family partition protein [Clostridia bacterium]|nr:ParB/RepB/Spo0J family partition protein [Clostridia bacterium]